MRYVCLSVIAWERTYYVRARDSVAVDFDGHAYEPSTIFLREVAHENYVRLRNLATGRYLVPIGNSLKGLAQSERTDAGGLLWAERWVDTDHIALLGGNNHYLTATPWFGWGSNEGEEGVNVGTEREYGKAEPGQIDLMSEVPPDSMLPWPGNRKGTVEEFVTRNRPAYDGYSAAQLKALARELQLTFARPRIKIRDVPQVDRGDVHLPSHTVPLEKISDK